MTARAHASCNVKQKTEPLKKAAPVTGAALLKHGLLG